LQFVYRTINPTKPNYINSSTNHYSSPEEDHQKAQEVWKEDLWQLQTETRNDLARYRLDDDRKKHSQKEW